jgi:hypothetical protein
MNANSGQQDKGTGTDICEESDTQAKNNATVPQKKKVDYVEYTLSDLVNRSTLGEVIEKILKPEGTGGRDFNIRIHMGLDTGEADDKEWYRDILVSFYAFVTTLLIGIFEATIQFWCDKLLDTRLSLCWQDQRKVILVQMTVSIINCFSYYAVFFDCLGV